MRSVRPGRNRWQMPPVAPAGLHKAPIPRGAVRFGSSHWPSSSRPSDVTASLVGSPIASSPKQFVDFALSRWDEEMSAEMVGRDEELSSLCAVLDRTADGPAALVLEGEAGIGKSTLWRAGVDAARARE